MNMSFFIILGLSFLSFIIPAICYARISKKGTFNQSALTDSPAFITSLSLFPLSLAAYFLFYQSDSFVSNYNIWQLPITFGGALLIASCEHLNFLNKKEWLILPICILIALIVMPNNGFTVINGISPLLNKIILGFSWLAFAAFYRYANSGNGLLASQSITITLGIGILSVLHAAPLLLGVYGWIYAAAFAALAVFSWYPTRIKISSSDATAFGFILFSLIFSVSSEGAISCCVIFSMYFLVDFIWALLLKLTFLPRFDNIYNNCSVNQAIANGLNPAQAASVTVKIQILMLLFGCFQIYSPTPWSLLFISTLIAIWLIYRFRNVIVAEQSLKDINTKVLEELQDRMDEFKSYIKKDDNL